MSFGGGRGNGKNFDMDDFISDASMSDNSTQATAGTSLAPMPGTAPGSIGNGNRPSSGDGKDDFRLSTDKATLRAAFEKLGLDLSLLENIYSENISLNDIQSLLASLDKDTLQKLMQEIMGNDPSGFGGTGSFGMGSSDVKLQYIDDDIDSYSNIWNNAKTDITTSDQMRLIASLKKLSEGEDIASVVDIEQVLRYFVVHNFVCNGDSYTGSMIHNYYLYEDDGQLAMLPWDYNLAYGTFSGGDATGTVNTPIDLPVSGGSSDRPMLNWIFESAAYTEQYHQYFAEFLTSVD
ncbi:MAG: CotH kinase family protein, partial [Clostridia bacterium]|nr:CotH kinase family protein [Clostridia bacterium]